MVCVCRGQGWCGVSSLGEMLKLQKEPLFLSMGSCSGWVGGGFLLSGSPEEAVLGESKESPLHQGSQF